MGSGRAGVVEGAKGMGATACWGLLLARINTCLPDSHTGASHHTLSPWVGWGGETVAGHRGEYVGEGVTGKGGGGE